MIPSTDKLANAACADIAEADKRKFFARGKEVLTAAAVCRTCPAIAPCLELALANELPGERRYGVYGGLTAGDRNRLFGESA